jgi:FtsP/CotA-like multicopper oxidase with cupredoxin domain
MDFEPNSLSRRKFIYASGFLAAGLSSLKLLGRDICENSDLPSKNHAHGDMGTVGNYTSDTLDPEAMLRNFDYGKASKLPSGRTLREFEFVAVDKEIEIAPGVFFPAWTYNGRVPGPSIRANYGDLIRIQFLNQGSHPHTIHFHGFHKPEMDGSLADQFVNPGQSFLYEFDADPWGLHLYHCHSTPLKRHIHKGLYGAYIVDPPKPRPKAKEFVMVMNAFDTNFDGDNEVYAVNSVAFHHMHNPIEVEVNELVRVYLVNITEFDPINSFHIHASFFYENRTGTKLEGDNFTDTVMLCQGERSILEMRFKYPGKYMFHAHQSWMDGIF